MTSITFFQLYCVPKFSAAKIFHGQTYLNDNTRNQSKHIPPLILSWNKLDQIIRVDLESTPNPLIHCKQPVTCVEIGDRFIYIGFSSGEISSIRYEYIQTESSAMTATVSSSHNLYAHSDSILSITHCPEFGIMTSSSKDKTIIIWDTVQHQSYPTYVRSINLDGPVHIVEISKTSGDIACVNSTEEGIKSEDESVKSVLSLHTINGKKIASRICEPKITALTFSTAPEGLSVNVIATGHGLRTGVIRLWSSWDLSPVRDIPTSQMSTIISITYSLDNSILYVATEDDEVIIFEQPRETNQTSTKKYTPKICVLSSL